MVTIFTLAKQKQLTQGEGAERTHLIPRGQQSLAEAGLGLPALVPF